VHLDLHVHSRCSDGAVAPEALPGLARAAGLHAIAVTDHDTAAGVVAAAAAAREVGVLVIPGAELTCLRDGVEVHLLGYGIDPENAALAALCARRLVMRRDRVAEMVERLRSLGVAIGVDDVPVPAGNVAVGRPHLADALVRRGVVRTAQEAFNRFLADGGPAWVPATGPDLAEAIAVVRGAGGCAVWAHPELEDARQFAAARALGLEGAETLRPSLAPTASSALEHAAREAGLFVTGGSDWHGGHPALGSWYVTDRHVRGLLDRLGVEVH
jgi:hypothetical protein